MFFSFDCYMDFCFWISVVRLLTLLDCKLSRSVSVTEVSRCTDLVFVFKHPRFVCYSPLTSTTTFCPSLLPPTCSHSSSPHPLTPHPISLPTVWVSSSVHYTALHWSLWVTWSYSVSALAPAPFPDQLAAPCLLLTVFANPDILNQRGEKKWIEKQKCVGVSGLVSKQGGRGGYCKRCNKDQVKRRGERWSDSLSDSTRLS